MGSQSVRMRVRREAKEAQARLRQDRKAREKRLSALGEEVMVSLGERDAVIRDFEQRAGRALRQMVDVEGMSLGEAAHWCGEGMTQAEARRLRTLTEAVEGSSEPVE